MTFALRSCSWTLVLLIGVTYEASAQEAPHAGDSDIVDKADAPSVDVGGPNFQGSPFDLAAEILSRFAVRLFSGNEAELLSGNKTKAFSENRLKLLSNVHLHLFSGNQIEIEIEGNANNGSHNDTSLPEDSAGTSGLSTSSADEEVDVEWQPLTSTLANGKIQADSRLRAVSNDEAEPATADLAQIQGLWERTERSGLFGTRRITKQIEGDQETVTYFNSQGKVQDSHTVTISVRRVGPLRIFSYDEMTIAAGVRKGEKIENQGEYIYKVVDDKFIEIWGVLGDGDEQINVLRWTRSTRDSE